MRFELERGNVDGFAERVSRHLGIEQNDRYEDEFLQKQEFNDTKKVTQYSIVKPTSN